MRVMLSLLSAPPKTFTVTSHWIFPPFLPLPPPSHSLSPYLGRWVGKNKQANKQEIIKTVSAPASVSRSSLTVLHVVLLLARLHTFLVFLPAHLLVFPPAHLLPVHVPCACVELTDNRSNLEVQVEGRQRSPQLLATSKVRSNSLLVHFAVSNRNKNTNKKLSVAMMA